MKHKFNYKWTLKDANFTKDKGKVFSCFACGGGSTMGYKLAGFDVIGCNEIDPKMMEAYIANHHPKYSYLEPIQTFKLRDDLPQELYELDILDGSPPCSSFSMVGNRGKDWGKEKKFKEGQADQVLDTLFFDFIELGKKLQPKVIVAENVKGLILGDAQKYVSKILDAFNDAGYFVDFKLLNASKMGVPQRRERVFFYAIRKDLYSGLFVDLFRTRPKLGLEFCENEIQFGKLSDGNGKHLSELYHGRWLERRLGDMSFGDITERIDGKAKCFSDVLFHHDRVGWTITSGSKMVDFETGRCLTDNVLKMCGSFPSDYIGAPAKAQYLIGMSVPPIMMAQVATRIYEQWFEGAMI